MRRKNDCKYRASPSPIRGQNAAALSFDKTFDDVQTEAGSAGGGVGRAVERVEDALDLVPSEARPAIGDLESQFVIGAMRCDRDRRSWGSMNCGIQEDVRDSLIE